MQIPAPLIILSLHNNVNILVSIFWIYKYYLKIGGHRHMIQETHLEVPLTIYSLEHYAIIQLP